MHDLDGLRAANEIFRSALSVPIVMYSICKNKEFEATAKLLGIRRVIGKKRRSAEPDEGNCGGSGLSLVPT